MRLAIFSDIHGNSIGLDAVLADIEANGRVDGYWVLGDHVGNGPDPAGVMRRLLKLENAEFISGNADRYVATKDRPKPRLETVMENPNLVRQYGEIQGNFAWTAGIMVELGWMDWLVSLPASISMTLPNGKTIAGYHASPWSDDGLEYSPNSSDEHVQILVDGCEADLNFFGHTHWPLDQTFGDKRLVNVGSVGNPLTPSLLAFWSLLEADQNGYSLSHFEVEYDRMAVIEQISKKHHPGAEFISGYYRGERLKTLNKKS